MNAIMQWIMVLLIVLGLSGSNTLGQDTIPTRKLTFEQAWELTTQNSHVFKQVQFLKAEKTEAAWAAKGLYLPKIGVNASYMLMSEDLTLDLTDVKNAILPLYQVLIPAAVPQVANANWDPTIQKKQFGVVAATFQMPLYTGGKIAAANKVAKIERNEVDEVMRQKEGELMSELVERYFGLCLAFQAVQIRKDVLVGMNKHLQDAEKMEKQGLIASAEVLHAHVYQAQANRELKKAWRTIETIHQGLINTMAMQKDTVIEPVSELFYLDSIEPVISFLTLATARNPLLLQVDHKKLLADQNYKVQCAEYFPQIAIQGMYDVVNKDLSPYLPNWTVGIGLKWTLFDGAARYRKTRAASFKSEEVEEIKQKAESDVASMVTKLYNELNMYKEQLVELETAKTFSEEYLRVREKAFHQEMSNATEVVDANLALAQVRIERLQVMYGYDLTLARLLQYSGVPEQFAAYRLRPGIKTESYKEENRSLTTKNN